MSIYGYKKEEELEKASYEKALADQKEIDQRNEEWLKTQKKCKVVLKLLNGETVESEEFSATAWAYVSKTFCYPGYFTSHVKDCRDTAKQCATEWASSPKDFVLKDRIILRHAVESLKIEEIE